MIRITEISSDKHGFETIKSRLLNDSNELDIQRLSNAPKGLDKIIQPDDQLKNYALVAYLTKNLMIDTDSIENKTSQEASDANQLINQAWFMAAFITFERMLRQKRWMLDETWTFYDSNNNPKQMNLYDAGSEYIDNYIQFEAFDEKDWIIKTIGTAKPIKCEIIEDEENNRYTLRLTSSSKLIPLINHLDSLLRNIDYQVRISEEEPEFLDI